MIPTLYPDQMDTANKLRSTLPVHRHVLLQAAAGSGKTQIASYATDQAFRKGKRVVFTCHRAELITQTSSTFSRWNVPHSFVASKLPYEDMPIRIASIDTLKNRIKRSPEQCYADILIIDETHERDVNTDFSLTLLKGMMASPTASFIPRLVLMSATASTGLFVSYFSMKGVVPASIEVPGKTFPVDTQWLGLTVIADQDVGGVRQQGDEPGHEVPGQGTQCAGQVWWNGQRNVSFRHGLRG